MTASPLAHLLLPGLATWWALESARAAVEHWRTIARLHALDEGRQAAEVEAASWQAVAEQHERRMVELEARGLVGAA